MRKVALGCLLVAAASVASATESFNPTGTVGCPLNCVTINAQADFLFSQNLLTLTLTNMLAAPSTVGQNISGFSFTIASLSGTTPTLVPYNGAPTGDTIAPELVNITNGVPTFNTNGGAGFDPGWVVTIGSGNFALNGLNGSANGPAYTIVGPPGSGYPSNGSLDTTSHNPMIFQSAKWVFNIVDFPVTDLRVTNVLFTFGTAGTDTFACDASNDFCASVPEPGAWLLLGTGLVGLAFFAHRTARKKTA